MRRINARRFGTRSEAGMILPLVIVFSIILMAGLAMITLHSEVGVRNMLNIMVRDRGEAAAQTALQQGLVSLSERLAYLDSRIINGIPTSDPDERRYISNIDIENYVLTNPSAFLVEWLNNITDNANQPVANQPNFIVESPTSAYYDVSTSSYDIRVQLVSAMGMGHAPVEATNSAGYNNVTLRYGYRITAMEKMSGNQKSHTIASSLRAEHVSSLIQIHLVRELSRFNLFAENNTTRTGTILYDKTSYTGRVYSKNTFYVAGTGANEPRYADVVEISNQASPPWAHKENGLFTFKKPNGSANPPQIIDPVSLPSSVDMDTQKDLCHLKSRGQNPGATTVPGIYVGTSSFAGTARDSSIFVNANGLPTTIRITVNEVGINNYRVEWNGVTRNITQPVDHVSAFVIFVDGPLSIEGTVAEGTKLTINATNNLILTNSLAYESGSISANTVMGIVSWQGDVLVSRNVPVPAGQTIANVVIHGVIMAIDGAFGAEGYEDFDANYPGGYKGTISHKGAFVRKWNLPTLSEDGRRGWGLVSEYDIYLAEAKAPPFFPGNGRYKLVDKHLRRVVDSYVRS